MSMCRVARMSGLRSSKWRKGLHRSPVLHAPLRGDFIKTASHGPGLKPLSMPA